MQDETVTIMTIHAAKGLEFDNVFCVGWEEGVFPSQRAIDEGGLARWRKNAASPMSRSPARGKRIAPSSTPPTAGCMASGRAALPSASSRTCPPNTSSRKRR
jgi:hypothetical protein